MLEVTYRGRVYAVTTALAFGRSAQLVLDADNRYLHGEAGRFRAKGPEWFLHNTGSRLHLNLGGADGQLAELTPGNATIVPAGLGWVRVAAGGVTYELAFRLEASGATTRLAARSTGTVPFGSPLTPAQIDYAVTLARHRLVGLRLPPPGQTEIARLWGVTARTVGKTFEDIRARLRSDGVDGIETPSDLIEHLVTNRMVTIEHLVAAGLEDPDGPFRHGQTDH